MISAFRYSSSSPPLFECWSRLSNDFQKKTVCYKRCTSVFLRGYVICFFECTEVVEFLFAKPKRPAIGHLGSWMISFFPIATTLTPATTDPAQHSVTMRTKLCVLPFRTKKHGSLYILYAKRCYVILWYMIRLLSQTKAQCIHAGKAGKRTLPWTLYVHPACICRWSSWPQDLPIVPVTGLRGVPFLILFLESTDIQAMFLNRIHGTVWYIYLNYP